MPHVSNVGQKRPRSKKPGKQQLQLAGQQKASMPQSEVKSMFSGMKVGSELTKPWWYQTEENNT